MTVFLLTACVGAPGMTLPTPAVGITPPAATVPDDAPVVEGAADVGAVTSVLGVWPFGPARDVVVQGQVAYLLDGRALETLDLSASPMTQLGWLALSGWPQAGALLGEGVLLVALGADGLVTVDVSDSRSPQPLATLPLAAQDVAVVGDVVAAIAGNEMATLSLADPSAPVGIGRLDLGEPLTALELAGGVAYVGGESGDVYLVDLADPAQPALLSVWAGPADHSSGSVPETLDTRVQGVAASGTVLLVVNGPAGLSVVNVGDPTQPHTATTFADSVGGQAFVGVALSERTAYLALPEAPGGVLQLDLSNPALPQPLRFTPTGSGAFQMQPQDDVLLVTTSGGVLRVAPDFEGDVTAIPGYRTPEALHGATFWADHAILATGESGAISITLADPAQPRTAGKWQPGAPVRAVAAAEGRLLALLADGAGALALAVADLGDPAQPALLGQSEWVMGAAGAGVAALRAVDGVAYVAAGAAGLLVFDLGDPAAPALLGRDATLDARGLAVAGNRLYVGAHGAASSLDVFDISDPASIVRIGSVVLGGAPGAVVYQEGLVYLNVGGGLAVVDANEPTAPRVLGQFDVGPASEGIDLLLVGNVIYATDPANGVVRAYDVATLQLPQLVQSYEFAPQPVALAGWGERLVVVDRRGGVFVLE